MTTVVAGILERGGRVLACQRRDDQDHGGKWEFPGGKVEAGESPAEALARELAEELSIEAQIGVELERYEFSYPGRKPILLIFLRVATWRGEPDFRQFADARWEAPEQLEALDFLDGDQPFNRRFADPSRRDSSESFR